MRLETCSRCSLRKSMVLGMGSSHGIGQLWSDPRHPSLPSAALSRREKSRVANVSGFC